MAFEETLIRLAGTTVELTENSDLESGGHFVTESFSLIDEFKVVRRGKKREDPKATSILTFEILLSDFFFNAVLAEEVFSLNDQYFQLSPTNRRLYEVGRKHVGKNRNGESAGKKGWRIGLGKFFVRSGIKNSARKKDQVFKIALQKFRFEIRAIVAENKIPDYSVDFDQSKDQLIFHHK